MISNIFLRPVVRMKRAKTGEMLRTVTLLPCGVPRLPDGVSFCPPGKLWVEQGKAVHRVKTAFCFWGQVGTFFEGPLNAPKSQRVLGICGGLPHGGLRHCWVLRARGTRSWKKHWCTVWHSAGPWQFESRWFHHCGRKATSACWGLLKECYID